MKTAIYLEDGVTQLVLTPENEWEKAALDKFQPGTQFNVCHGSFYECRGGWYRQGTESESLLLTMFKPEPPKAEGGQ